MVSGSYVEYTWFISACLFVCLRKEAGDMTISFSCFFLFWFPYFLSFFFLVLLILLFFFTEKLFIFLFVLLTLVLLRSV